MRGRYRVGVLLIVASAAVLFMSPAARADSMTWTFHDEGEPMFVTLDGGTAITSPVCDDPQYGVSGENCYLHFNRQGATITSVLVPSGSIAPNNFFITPVLEFDGSHSDSLYTGWFTTGLGDYTFQTYLFSDVEGGNQDHCFDN